MNMSKTIFVFSVLLLMSFNVNAKEPLRVIDRGMDGNKRYYAIACPDGVGTSTVTQEFDFDSSPVEPENTRTRSIGSKKDTKLVKVCIFPYAGREQCRPQWELDKAAEESCKKTPPAKLTKEQEELLSRPQLGQ